MLEETSSTMNKGQRLKELFKNFMEIDRGIEAIIVSDEEGLMIAGEKRKDINMEIISFLTAVVNPIIERIRNEFAFKRFGTASFDTDEHRLLFISIDGKTTISLVFEDMVSIDKLYPYAYFLTEKIAQILNFVDGDIISLSFPNFDIEEQLSKKSNKLKYQIYQGKIEEEGSYRFKFIITGDHNVGKTSLIRRFVENRFLVDYRTTIGLNILSHNFEAFGNKVNLSLWDIGAQRYFRRYRKTYYKGAQAVFIVFDLTSRESFENVKNWYLELNDFIENKDLPILIVGNKNDLNDQRVIAFEEGVKLANDLLDPSKITEIDDLSGLFNFSNLSENLDHHINYIETSALTGDNVGEAFNLLSYHFMVKSKEIDEIKSKQKVFNEISSILKNYGNLTLTFLTEDPLYNPCLQILSELSELGEYSKLKDKKEEKLYKYPNGLILKHFIYDSLKNTDSDGIFCIFDARERKHIDPKWKETILEISERIEKNKVLLIGIRVSEKIEWSHLMEEFKITEELEEKIGSVLFFKIGENVKLELYELLEFMLNFIKQSLLTIKLDEKSKTISTPDLRKELKIREESLSSKVTEMKSKFEKDGFSKEIKKKKLLSQSLSKETQKKLNKVYTDIDILKKKIDKYEKKGKKDQKLAVLYYDVSLLYIKIQEYDRAIEELKRSLVIDPNSAAAWNVLGAIYYGMDDYDMAIKIFNELVKLKPDDHTIWYNLGRVNVKNGDYSNAINALERSLEININSAPTWNLLASTYYIKGNYIQAIKKFHHLTKLIPKDPKVWYNLGRAYVKNGQYEKAIYVLKHALDIDSKLAYVWNVLGAAYYGKGEKDLSLEAFQQYVVLEPEDHTAWYNLGEVLFSITNYDEALVACNYSLEIMPDFEEALNLRERVLSNL